MTSIAEEDISFALSYAFWQYWFTDHRTVGLRSRLEPYKWPQPYAAYKAMLNHRSCPFCHEQRRFRIDPVVLNGPTAIDVATVDKVHCLCQTLVFMDTAYDVPDSFWNPSKLEDYTLWGNRKIDDRTLEIKEHVKYFIQAPIGWHYLYGTYGAGKTKILEIIKTRLRGLALFLNMGDLSDIVFEATGNHNLSEVIRTISEAPVLLLDDIGAEYPNDYFYSSLYKIINNRYARRAPTFFTSNLTLDQLRLKPQMDYQRISDRINDVHLTNVLVSLQPSFRQRER